MRRLRRHVPQHRMVDRPVHRRSPPDLIFYWLVGGTEPILLVQVRHPANGLGFGRGRRYQCYGTIPSAVQDSRTVSRLWP